MNEFTNQVIEFLEGHRFICAVSVARKGSRFHLITHLGRELNLPPARFIHCSRQRLSGRTRSEQIRELQEINARRDSLKDKVVISDLWELIDGEKEMWTPSELTELAFSGPVTPDHEAALIRAIIEDRTYFKFKEGMIRALTEEKVRNLLELRAREQKRLERIVTGVKWLENLWSDNPDTKKSPPDNMEPYIAFWLNAIKDYCVSGQESEHAMAVRSLFKQAGISDINAPFMTLVRTGIWDEDENLDILRHGIEISFPEPVMRQAEKLVQRASSLENDECEDLTELHTFTIDAPDSRDLDDALSFRKIGDRWEIGIHITSIGLQIDPDSPLFKNAVNRATTIYLPDQIIPMLPEMLSNDTWSLMEGTVRRAISFFVNLDGQGQIVNSRITRSLIRISRRLSYEEADRMICEKDTLCDLHRLCLDLQAHRISKGALPLPIPEQIFRIDSTGRVDVKLSRPGPARFLIAECMILANMVAADFLRERHVPALYRSQPPPQQRIIRGDDTDIKANFRQRRFLSRGNLGPKPDFHAGLGLEAYTTITSPLRRGLDLVMQQQIASVLRDGTPLHTEQEIENLSIYLQQGLIAAAAVRQARHRYWLIKHLAAKTGIPLNAWILETGNRKTIAILTDYLVPVELSARHGEKYSRDQDIRVKITKADSRANILKAGWY